MAYFSVLVNSNFEILEILLNFILTCSTAQSYKQF